MLHKFVFVLHLKTFKALLFMSLLCFGLCCYLISNHIIYLQNSPYLSISCRCIDAEKPNNQIAVTVQNLALAMYGMLTNHLFNYNQNSEEVHILPPSLLRWAFPVLHTLRLRAVQHLAS